MKSYIKNIFPAAALALTLGMTSCSDVLEISPKDPDVVTKITPSQLFNKCYANIGTAGQGGANGDCDIDGLDGGTTGYVRQLFNANELTTDEAICGWGDEGISAFDYCNYDASHPMLRGFYYRLAFGVTVCNEYLTEFGDNDATMSAEVRFLRALNYYELMDCFGNVPFTTVVGETPKQIKRADLYAWLEKELLEVEGSLSEAKPKTSSDADYGRVDKAAAWLLLARLYLNAEVYTGKAEWAKAQEYAKKVMDSKYQLYTTAKTDAEGQKWSAYQQLFMGDNGENGSSVEAIFPILQDGKNTTSWGTTLFLMAGATDANVVMKKDGKTTGVGTTVSWGGNRCRPDLLAKFFPNNDAPEANAYMMPKNAGDDRAIFDGVGRKLENTEVGSFTNGYATCKFNNFRTDGKQGNSSQFPDADFYFLRSAEAYLIYAEADARINNGGTTTAGTEAINALRKRANATTKTTSYSLREICDEWSREFYFEGLRRPTLIRFGYFGGNNNYKWQWKGGTIEGKSFSATKNIFAIPTQDLTVNPNLKQNPGY